MNLAEQLRQEEKAVPFAYQDNLGYWTIGIGRLVDRRKGGGLSEDEMACLLANDIRAKTSEVLKALPWVAKLNEPRQAVLIGMAFQMGTSGLLGFKQTLQAVQTGRWAEAEAGMLVSTWAKQTPERAKRMGKQMLTGEWQCPST